MIINHDSAATEMIIASVNEKSVEFKPISLMPYQHILRCLQCDHTLIKRWHAVVYNIAINSVCWNICCWASTLKSENNYIMSSSFRNRMSHRFNYTNLMVELKGLFLGIPFDYIIAANFMQIYF